MTRHLTIGYLLLAALILSGCSRTPPAIQTVTFASGRATVPLPGTFRVTQEGDGLVAVFGADSDHRLELTLIKALPGAGGATDLAVQFVKSQGAKKNAKVSLADGRAVFMEPGAKEERDGKTYQSVHWQIAVGNCLFAMTVAAPLPMSKELNAFLGDPLNAIAEGLACAAG